ncbi:unnamed protein product [Rotaria sp. Silwood2]|nr:unnamed protein product [Rotaria sp. Silwood2]
MISPIRDHTYFNPPESHRFHDEDINDFVNCLKECAFRSIFNKNHLDLATEIEEKACLSIGAFEDFMSACLNRIFQMIDTLSTDISDTLAITIDSKVEDIQIELELTLIISCIVQQCSRRIFHIGF